METLDDFYIELYSIYLDSNFDKDEYQVFAHLVEVVGGLSSVASEKKDRMLQVRKYMPKAIAWWLALAGKVGVSSVEQMLWVKYPGVCPYCTLPRHDKSQCKGPRNPKIVEPQWDVLEKQPPIKSKYQSIAKWQKMFGQIYSQNDPASMERVFARLTEELGELAEAIRVRRFAPAYFISEASDVFAWLMHIQTWYDEQTEGKNGSLSDWLDEAYPGKCLECGSRTCTCPAILPSAYGRMAHEVPDRVVPVALIPLSEMMIRLDSRVVEYEGRELKIDAADLIGLRADVTSLLRSMDSNHEIQGFQNAALLEVLGQLGDVSRTSDLNVALLTELRSAVDQLNPTDRAFLLEKFGDTTAAVGAGILAWLFTMTITGGTGVIS